MPRGEFHCKSDVEHASKRQTIVKKKNPAAVELGRLGGLKGGLARARKLSKHRRREIAASAARARWNASRHG